MTDTQPPTCGHPSGLPDSLDPCGAPASDMVDTGTETYPVCAVHLPAALKEGWRHVGSLTGGTTTTGPGDNLRDTPREALAAAWAAAPKSGTIEAKARQAHEWLVAHGWDVVDVREGPPVVLGPDEQVVTVPDGWTVDVRPEDPVTYTPGDQLIDPELSELAEIVARLEGLDPESRERVAAFVTHRYGPTVPAVSPWAALSGWDPSRLDRARAQGTYSTDLPGADGG